MAGRASLYARHINGRAWVRACLLLRLWHGAASRIDALPRYFGRGRNARRCRRIVFVNGFAVTTGLRWHGLFLHLFFSRALIGRRVLEKRIRRIGQNRRRVRRRAACRLRLRTRGQKLLHGKICKGIGLGPFALLRMRGGLRYAFISRRSASLARRLATAAGRRQPPS